MHSSSRLERVCGGLAALVWLGLQLAGAEPEARWPQFRGLQASGVDTRHALPTDWSLTPRRNVRWVETVPGLGHSSPVAWGDRIYVTTVVRPGVPELRTGLYGDIEPVREQVPHQWRLLAFDVASGRREWMTNVWEGVPRQPRHPKGSHCNSTPATDGIHIVALLGSEGLFCWDSLGRQRWRRDLGSLDAGYYQVPSAQWGFASSPVIHEGRVYVQADVQKGSFIAAFNLGDGSEVWRRERRDVPTWGTPTVVTAAGRTQVVVNGWHHSGGYEAGTGQELWRLSGGGDIPVPTPIVGDGLVYLTSGHGRFRPLRAIRWGAVGDITPRDVGETNGSVVWVHPRQGNYLQTPLVHGTNVWACYDNGILGCFEAATGRLRYSERLVAGGAGFTASPVSDGRHLFFPSENGDVYVVAAGPEFRVVATNRLDETCLATPAIADGLLLFRTRGQLIAVGR
jgi:outer membrane protein assembly factor BamB